MLRGATRVVVARIGGSSRFPVSRCGDNGSMGQEICRNLAKSVPAKRSGRSAKYSLWLVSP